MRNWFMLLRKLCTLSSEIGKPRKTSSAKSRPNPKVRSQATLMVLRLKSPFLLLSILCSFCLLLCLCNWCWPTILKKLCCCFFNHTFACVYVFLITYLSWHILQHHISMRTHLCQIWQDSSKLPKLQGGAVGNHWCGKQAWASGTCLLYKTAALMDLRWTDCSPERLGSQGSSRLLYTVSKLHTALDNIALK